MLTMNISHQKRTSQLKTTEGRDLSSATSWARSPPAPLWCVGTSHGVVIQQPSWLTPWFQSLQTEQRNQDFQSTEQWDGRWVVFKRYMICYVYFVCLWECTWTREQLVGVSPILYPVGLGDQSLVVRLGSKFSHLLGISPSRIIIFEVTVMVSNNW